MAVIVSPVAALDEMDQLLLTRPRGVARQTREFGALTLGEARAL